MGKSSVVVEVDVKRGHATAVLGIMVDACDELSATMRKTKLALENVAENFCASCGSNLMNVVDADSPHNVKDCVKCGERYIFKTCKKGLN